MKYTGRGSQDSKRSQRECNGKTKGRAGLPADRSQSTTLIESEVTQKVLTQLPERQLFNYIHVTFE